MATRLEPLGGYLTLASAISENAELQGEPFSFGPNTTNSQCFGTGQTDAITWIRCAGKTFLAMKAFPMNRVLSSIATRLCIILDGMPFGFEETVKMTSEGTSPTASILYVSENGPLHKYRNTLALLLNVG